VPRARIFARPTPAVLLLLAVAGCSGANLGDIDEEVNSREQMPGPGILADENGESTLKWSSDSKQQEAQSTTSQAAVAASASTATAMTPEQAEFEQYKAWNELRTSGADSPEYREFLQWLEYQQFKSNQ
jgi:hypothetical protein